MFGKKVSEEEYNELYKKYTVFEVGCKNEMLKNEQLEKEILELKNQLAELQEKGVVSPELAKNYGILEKENKQLKSYLTEASELREKATASIEASMAESDKIYKKIEIISRALDEERAKNAQLETALKNNGGNKMESNGITQWEYKNISYGGSSTQEESEKKLNQLGNEGWELAGTFSNDMGRGSMIFKRQKQPKQEKLSPEAAYWERMCRS